MTFVQHPADSPAPRTPTDATLEALRQAEAQYRSIFDNSLHGIYQSTPDGRFLNVNAAFARMLGYDSPAELISNCRQIERDYYADASIRAALRRALEEGGTVRGFECQARRRDGSLIWTRENFYAVRDAAGRLLYYEGSVEDVTERKEAELALAESEARYRQLFTDANDAIYTTDLAGDYTSANRACETITGYAREELLGMNFRQLAAPEHLTRVLAMMERKLSGDEATTCYEAEIITKSGERRSLEVSTQLIRAGDGAPVGVQGIARDVTERKRAEEALRVSESKYRDIINNATMGVYQSEPTGALLSVNPALARILGYDSAGELLGANIRALYFDAEERDRLIADYERGGARGGLEVRWRRRDGSPIWLYLDARAVCGDDGTTRYYEGFVHDITERRHAEEALRRGEERYRELFENANDVVYTHDLSGNFTSLNKTGERVTGYTREEALRMNIARVVVPECVPLARKMLGEKRGGEEATRYELEIFAKDGRRVPLEISTRLVFRDGAPVGVQGIARDITERRQSQRALEASEAELRALFAAMTDVILVLDRDGRYLKIAPTNPALLYKPPAEMLGKTLHEVFDAETADFFLAHVRRALDTGEPVNLEYRLDVVGAEHWFAGTVSPMREDAVIWVARDITERKQAEEKLLHIAFHDSLTNLPNRALFTDHLRLAVEAAKRHPGNLFAVLFLDLDRFKVINDSLGHTVGDELLVALARRLESTLRAGDTVARLGGDEFAILLNDLERPGDALHIADRIQQQITEPFSVCGQEVFTTASIGIALSTTGYTNEEDVLRDADTVMYRAKAQGAARYEVFDQVMHARVVSQLKLENDLRRAVERKEFSLYYQPIVSLESGRVKGFEALARWQHPERGLVSPAEFIPVAEETGLIVPLGLWVLEAACRQMREWHRMSPQNRDLKLSVNLSGRQFGQADLLERITRVLEETDFDPRCLQLEITESVVMENARAIVALMDELRALGIELAIDDFGTGYSSLSYLQRFPIHTLKIDRSFISPHGAEERENSEIVRTIILLARNMGKEVVAEGVETAEQYARLRELECSYGQGYLFSRPQDARATEELLREGLIAGLTLAPADDVQAA